MQRPADAVADVVLDDGAPVFPGHILHRLAHVSEPPPRPRCADAGKARCPGRLHQPPRIGARLPDEERPRSIAVPASYAHRGVERQHIPFFQDGVRGHSVRCNIVHGRANTPGEAPVAPQSRLSSVSCQVLSREPVEMDRGNPWLNLPREKAQTPFRGPARPSNAGDVD
jgi:hypothetical protein